MEQYTPNIALLKAFADPNRLLIIDTLARDENCTCDEYCACRLLENLGITQPTLSHHMRILTDCGLTIPRKVGKRTYYTLNRAVIDEFLGFLRGVTETGRNCSCICCENQKEMQNAECRMQK
ncbi:MAG: metalloregulator ArsR/SmtB family transcription factor [Oscillospiraceae bacterium]|nr:metalloregulator ArsR/SmtB family transcription factor [Oscillospiraceae bacterium]